MPYDASKDGRAGQAAGTAGPARRVVSAALSDTVDLPAYARSLYVGGAGTVVCIPSRNADDEPVTFANHPAGYMPIEVRRVFSTGTTATGILALI